MKVIHLADSALSGAPYRLAQVQRAGGLEARAITYRSHYGPRVFPHDVLVDDHPDVIHHLLATADVIHYHNLWKNQQIFRVYAWTWDLVKGKPAVIQFHSPREHSFFEEPLHEPSLVKLVVAQYQVRFYPECLPVPNAVPIDDPLHRPLATHNVSPIIAFTPPTCTHPECTPMPGSPHLPACQRYPRWANKGYRETMAVLQQGFRYDCVTNVSWEEAMQRRQRCDIAIDEVVTGSYHMCSLEALAQGLATIAGLDTLTIDALEMVTGTRTHPWIIARPDTLGAALRRLTMDIAYLRDKQRAARTYMERYWNACAITNTFRDIYALASP
jgi:hypothetical protein